MVFLWIAILVVDFFASQYEDAFLSFMIISVHPLYQNIVISNQENIHAGFKSRLPQFSVCTGTIRVSGVHVQIDDQFVHVFPFLITPPESDN